jgi:formylglycine-generating enzyme required for sulfatase activity
VAREISIVSEKPSQKLLEGTSEKTVAREASDTFAAGRSVRPTREPWTTPATPTTSEVARAAARFPSYEIVDEVGRGGMGVVFRARQIGLRREVAIKRVAAPHAAIRERFLAESRVAGRLDHPGIVPVYDLLVAEDGDVALVMKLVHGTSWKQSLHPEDEGARRDLDFHLGVLMSVCNAVAFAHSKGFSHNDLKPSNVMVGEFGEVLVVDWGLALDFRDPPDPAAVAQHKSTMDVPSGTPAYWAPELAKGKGADVGPWTDVYLLGAILYEIAAGHPPHRGRDIISAIMAAVSSELPRLDEVVPPGLREICRKAMEPLIANRYQDVAAFQAAVRAYLKHRESRALTAAAAVALEQALAAVAASSARSGEAGEAGEAAERARIYTELAEAATGFRQAGVLWPDNPEARAGERRAELSLATVALESGDFGFAEVRAARLDPADPEVTALLGRIRAAAAFRVRSAQIARLTRGSLAAAVGVIVVGLAAGLVTLRAEHRRSEAGFALAMERLDGIHRLADVKQLADYAAEADELWPARPDRVSAMEAWLVKARTLAGHLDGDRAYLEGLRRNAQETAPSYRFATREEQWEHDTLAALVGGLEVFARTAIPELERRLERARTVALRTLDEPREAWQRAVASIADARESPAYGGLHITPQLGLIPLGKDPRSGLWEFASVESGEVPRRGPDGKLGLTAETGVVLVLLPGGTFAMGTQPPDADHPKGAPGVDPEARRSERPVHDVPLAPFFLAKHEVTQGQWLRATGNNPSAYPSGVTFGGKLHTLLHPVEQVGWKEVKRTLGHLGLRLPTEAQWEYAARAGTRTVYWTGDVKESLRGAANLADAYCKDNGGPGSWSFETWLDDGYVLHAPVGSYAPNAFGLHDTAGNVWEWVEDRYGSYDLPVSPGDGERKAPADRARVFRGGGFRSNAVHMRSADRYDLFAPDYRGFDVGARAARALE